MSVTFVLNFDTEVSTVQDVSPSINYLTISSENGLIKIQTVEVECHSIHTKASEPNTHHREGSKEEMKAATIVKASVLENKASEVAMRCNNVVGLLFLSEFVTIIVALLFGGLSN